MSDLRKFVHGTVKWIEDQEHLEPEDGGATTFDVGPFVVKEGQRWLSEGPKPRVYIVWGKQKSIASRALYLQGLKLDSLRYLPQLPANVTNLRAIDSP
jgi:hypothetical protein